MKVAKSSNPDAQNLTLNSTVTMAQRPLKTRSKRVVIVDDSKVMRMWLRHVLDQDPKLEVVGEAASAQEARQVIKSTSPDVITLDIEMPGMNGLDFLARLMALRPMPVVMISGATQKSSQNAITALSLGAVDVVPKPDYPTDMKVHANVVQRVYAAACSKVQAKGRFTRRTRAPVKAPLEGPQPIVLIGSSTGGVAALQTVLGDLRPNSPPVVVVQHMPQMYLESFSQYLDQQIACDVSLLKQDEPLAPGQVRFAPEVGKHTQISRQNGIWSGKLRIVAGDHLHCPSVDTLFLSAQDYGPDVIAVILTGLGSDGAAGMKALHDAGAATIGQDEHTSVVYGMPKAAWRLGAVDHQMPVERIGTAIKAAAQNHNLRNKGQAR